jgi:undecaprenyl-diphosphatase
MLDRADRATLTMLIAGVVIVVALAGGIASGASDSFDAALINAIRGDALDGRLLSPLRYVTELGSTGAVSVIALFALVAGIAVGRGRLGLVAALTIVLAAIGNSLLKIGFARARPDLLDPIVVERGFSFPSGHAALSMVAYGVVAVMIWRSPIARWARRAAVVLLALVILAVGVSRVWLGVHYPTDVLAGWTLGALVVLLFARLTRSVTSPPAAEAAGADRAGQRSDPPGPA